MIRSYLLGLALFATSLASNAQTIQVNKDNRTIAITTTDEAQAIADRAVVSIGFTTYGADQDQTYADASKLSNAIMAALKAAGIKPEAIEARNRVSRRSTTATSSATTRASALSPHRDGQ